ncbi:MAG: hypothetical protein IH621_14485 [Krumholzibacteria bacterium]|nr:hypothetical protein [Candidatus Krumholzibacteria bacterium]
MKIIVTAILLLVVATGAFAQGSSIYDIQTGLIAEGTLVTPRGVVTGVTANGFFVAEAPYDAWRGIWVYAPAHGMVPGDDVQLCGLYAEYFGLSEIDIVAAGLYGSVLKMGTLPVPAPNVVNAADIWNGGADAESWESCMITVQDGMEVTALPNTYGEWFATALDGTEVMFDDYWYDDTQVQLLQCYNNATGILNFSFGNFKLEAFADGIPIVDCAVPAAPVTFSELKALYR